VRVMPVGRASAGEARSSSLRREGEPGQLGSADGRRGEGVRRPHLATAKLGLRLFSRSRSLSRSTSRSRLSLIHLMSAGSHRCISSASSCLLIGWPDVDPAKVVTSFGGHSSGLWSSLSTLRCVIEANQTGRRLKRFLAMEKTCGRWGDAIRTSLGRVSRTTPTAGAP